jgi:hypothetical protein
MRVMIFLFTYCPRKQRKIFDAIIYPLCKLHGAATFGKTTLGITTFGIVTSGISALSPMT